VALHNTQSTRRHKAVPAPSPAISGPSRSPDAHGRNVHHGRQTSRKLGHIMESATGNDRRVLILGDSWIHGLGSGRRVFGLMIAKELMASDILDLSAISRTAPDIVRDHMAEITAFAPHLTIMNIGGADSLIFPAPWIQRFVDRHAPIEWQGVEGLMPLAMYSRDRRRRIKQKVEQFAKTVIKQLLVNLFGGHRRVSLDELQAAAKTILDAVTRNDGLALVIGFGFADGWTSPKSNASLGRTNALLEALCLESPSRIYIPAHQFLRRWDDYLMDRVHLNLAGHRHITEGVINELSRTEGPWLMSHQRAYPDVIG
jgi:hypothetical protein